MALILEGVAAGFNRLAYQLIRRLRVGDTAEGGVRIRTMQVGVCGELSPRLEAHDCLGVPCYMSLCHRLASSVGQFGTELMGEAAGISGK